MLAIGGKGSPNDWTNSVECLDLAPYFKEGLTETDSKGNRVKLETNWKEIAPMNYARSNFAAINLANRVYVFGGISGQDP